jgi:site-specific DNA-methyltransferase (adenine-specific)
MELKTVDISSIIVGERFREEYGDIDTLASSLKREGQIQPLAVKQDGDKYILLAGGRRIRALKQAEISEVAIRIYPDSISIIEMRSIELMENICRKDLSWIEATNLRKEIHELQVQIHGTKVSTSLDAEGWSKRDTAELLGKSTGSISEDINLANAIAIFPQLKEAKNKQEAQKMLKKLQEELVMAEIATRIRNKQADTPLERLRSNMIDCYVLGDFFDYVRKLPDNSVDIVEIDPPYGIDLHNIKKYEDNSGVGTKNYNEVPSDQYIPFLDNLFKECYRVMSENSWLICWFAQEPWFEIVYQSMMRVGLKGNRVAAIWHKENSSGQSMQPGLHLGNVYEPFFYVRKGSPAIIKQGRSNVFSFKTVSPGRKVHPTERPVELIQDILQTFAWEGCRLMVPFLGSGNTLLAAANIGITAFGFDLTEDYRNAYTLRVNEGRPGAYKSYKEVAEDA